MIFSAINDFIAEQAKSALPNTHLRRIRVVNWDQETTDYMKAEFDFITETSTSSLEADHVLKIGQFRDVLNTVKERINPSAPKVNNEIQYR